MRERQHGLAFGEKAAAVSSAAGPLIVFIYK
jgi:hypothetical protein